MLLPIHVTNTIISTLTQTWNITRFAFGANNIDTFATNVNSSGVPNVPNITLRVRYPKYSYSPSKRVGGTGFYANPAVLQNATSATLQYQVLFDRTFDPVLGGKLPGLYIGDGTDFSGGSGGNHTENSSCRIAWRANWLAEAYVYLPTQQPEYYRLQNKNDLITNRRFGDSLWRSSFTFQPNVWNNVTIHIRLNTFNTTRNNTSEAKANGLLGVTINNVTRSFDKIVWTTNPEHRIRTIVFSTFFGGSTERYATPNDTWTYFKNIYTFNHTLI